MAIHVRKTYREKRTAVERASDGIAQFTGSWTFIVLHVVLGAGWFLFGFSVDLLTLILSIEAIFLAAILLMASNRREARDDIRDDADYAADMQSEKEIRDVKITLRRIEEKLKR